MKKNILSLFIAVCIVTFYTSCEKVDGSHYTGENNKVSFVAGSTMTSPMDLDKGYLEIPVGRTSSEGELAVKVNFSSEEEGYADVFTIAEDVSFSNNKAKSYVKINVGDITTIDPAELSLSSSGFDVNVGLGYPFVLSFDDKSLLSPSESDSLKVTANNALEFEDIGEATLNSEDGWEEETIQVPIQKATGVDVYKLVQPFGFNSLAFMIESDGKTVVFPDQVFYDTGEEYGPVTMSGVEGEIDEEGNIVLTVSSYQVEAGTFGDGVEIITLPN